MAQETIYSSIRSNKLKSFLYVAFFFVLIIFVGTIVGKFFGYGLSFAGVMLIISGIISFVSYFYSDKIVLSMSGASEIKEKDHPRLYKIVENMSIASGLPIPKVYLIQDPAPNAFATGRDPKHAAVAATSGLVNMMSDAELEGVMAHEMSHVKNFDTRLMAIVAVLAGSIALLSDIFMRGMFFSSLGGRDDKSNSNGIFLIISIVAVVLAPIAATLIQLAVSRKREFLADSSAALLTRYPEGLASALEKISSYNRPMKHASNATAHLYIENPFGGGQEKKKSWLVNLFSTHPPVEERIKALRAL